MDLRSQSKYWTGGFRSLGYEPNRATLTRCDSVRLTRVNSLETPLSTSSFGANLVPTTNAEASSEFASTFTGVPCMEVHA